MDNQPQDARYAPPQSHVEDVALPTEGLQLAGRGRRFGAAMIDLACAVAALWLVSVTTPWNPFAPKGSMWTPDLANTALGFALFVGMHGYLLAVRGQTIGKALLKIRIARPDGAAASFGRVVGLRYGLAYLITVVPGAGQIYGLVDALLIFRRSRRCLHDTVADTVVLQA